MRAKMPAMQQSPSIAVFDVGGVLLDWNPRHLYRKMFDDADAMEHFLTTVCTREWNLQLDAGRGYANGIAELVERFPDQADLIRAYDERWPEMVAGVIEGTVEILETLQAGYRPVYAITNFSAEKFALSRALWPFLDAFDGVVVSGEVKALKPQPEIFRILFERHDLTPSDCLFIDDVPANVAGAEAVGMHGHHFTSPERLRRDLEAVGIL